ncbi:MAG: hypothetical protein VKJ09_06155, partial [Leptolyngbya sp.]|nr:hypothetical protein [Leptolyngbya sp.]
MAARVPLEFRIPPDHPQLLAGLEAWVQLGLISDVTVRQMAASHLVCPLPSPKAVPIAAPAPVPAAPRVQVPHTVRAFVDELSVIWLLLVGVFLVVVSSVVLAATQWQAVPPTGQYAILLVYTLAFWQLGQWTGRRDNLQATSRMLQVTTLLIIPINFWMMAALGLRQGLGGMALALGAAIALSAITLQLLGWRHRWLGWNGVLLAWLHWGWYWPGVALGAIYGGVMVTAILARWRLSARSLRGPVVLTFACGVLVGRGWLVAGIPLTQLALAVGLLGWGLLGQSGFQDRANRRGTGAGTGRGSMIASQGSSRQRALRTLGSVALGLGWCLGLAAPPLQGLGLSGLVLASLAGRVRRRGEPWLWLLALVVGLQGYGQLWQVIPAAARSRLVSAIAALFASPTTGLDLLGLGYLPFFLALVVLARRLGRSPYPRLAAVTEGFGLMLMGLGLMPSLPHAGPRALYVLGVFLVLAWGYGQRSRRPGWGGYLLHGIGLLALIAWVEWLVPAAVGHRWGWILLALTVAEWVGVWVGRSRPGIPRALVQQSWYLGLGLAIASYLILLGRIGDLALMSPPGQADGSLYGGLPWLLVPGLLTLLAGGSASPGTTVGGSHPTVVPGEAAVTGTETDSAAPPTLTAAPERDRWHTQRTQAAWLGVVAGWLAVGVGITTAPAALITLSVVALGTGLISRRLPYRGVTALAVGWAVAGSLVALWTYGPSELADWTGLAVVVWGLWLLRAGLQRGSHPLWACYRDSVNGWGIAIAAALLTGATGVLLWQLLGGEPLSPSGNLTMALGLMVAAIAFRLWQAPTNLGYLALAWGGELLLLQGWWTAGVAATWLLWGHSALALGTQLLGDGVAWVWRGRRSPMRKFSWAAIPLGFGTLALAQAHLAPFTQITGLYTGLVGLVGIGIGRRHRRLGLFTYGGAGLLSLGAYELLGYYLAQQSGGELGDGITLLALLATAIAFAMILSQRWLQGWWRWSLPRLQTWGHLHWGLAVLQAFSAVLAGVSPTGRWLWIGQGILLAGYALWQGRRRGAWVYGGLILGLLTVFYALPEAVVMDWAGAIAATLAVTWRWLPWSRWGWSVIPWRRSAWVMPGVVAWLGFGTAQPASTLLVAAAYGWLAL